MLTNIDFLFLSITPFPTVPSHLKVPSFTLNGILRVLHISHDPRIHHHHHVRCVFTIGGYGMACGQREMYYSFFFPLLLIFWYLGGERGREDMLYHTMLC